MENNFIIGIRKSVEAIKSLTLEDLKFQPLVLKIAGIEDPFDIAKVAVYARFERSVSTGLGTRVDSFMARNFGKKSKFDGADIDKDRSVIQQKMTTRTTSVRGLKAINRDLKKAKQSPDVDRVIFGICMPDDKSSAWYKFVTTYIDETEIDILVGEPYWDFLTGDPNYFKDLIESIPQQESIIKDLEDKVKEIAVGLIKRYNRDGSFDFDMFLDQTMS